MTVVDEQPRCWLFFGVLSDLVIEQELRIDKEISIRLPSRDEIEILTDLIPDGEWNDKDLGWLQQEIGNPVIFMTQPGDYREIIKSALGSFRRIVTAMRIASQGNLRLTVFAYYPPDDDFLYWGSLKTLEAPAWAPKGQQHMIGPPSVPRIANLYAKLNSHELDRRVARAIDNFNSAFTDERPASRLWNCWAGLGALFWDRAADRGYYEKCLVCKRISTATKMPFERLRDSYAMKRSKPVHGESDLETVSDADAAFILDALRQSICVAIEDPVPFDRTRRRYDQDCRRSR